MALQDKEIKKREMAKEIVLLFKKFKIAILLSFIFFISYSFNNKLIQIAILDYKFAWFEAQDILGYIPQQYTNIEDSAEYIPNTNLKTLSNGHFEISDEGYLEVKKQVISILIHKSLEITIVMLPFIFGFLISLHYLVKSIKWVKKYSS